MKEITIGVQIHKKELPTGGIESVGKPMSQCPYCGHQELQPWGDKNNEESNRDLVIFLCNHINPYNNIDFSNLVITFYDFLRGIFFEL